MNKSFTEEKFVICHNGADVVHGSKVSPGTVLTSGQPEYEEFDSEEAWKARMIELGADPDSHSRERPEREEREERRRRRTVRTN